MDGEWIATLRFLWDNLAHFLIIDYSKPVKKEKNGQDISCPFYVNCYNLIGGYTLVV